jgi:hypothetical protein
MLLLVITYSPYKIDDIEKMPLKTVWEDWETYRDWQDFTPHPGDPKWDQLPESIKSTVKRTSEELGRYASAKKSSFGLEKVPLLRKL